MLGIPEKIVAGDYVRWTDPLAEGSLSWAIRGVGVSLNITATIEDNNFVTVISSDDSGNLPPGVYSWQAYRTMDGNRETIGTGRIKVEPNFVNLNSYDPATESERLLAQVRTAIQSVLSSGQEYKIGEREFTRADLSELREWETRLKFQVYREGKALRGESANLKIRFRREYG